MFNGKNWIIILLGSHSIEIMTPDSEVVQQLPLPSTIINNNELLNRDGLESVILDWAKLRTYTSTEIIWLLSPSIYFDLMLPQDNILTRDKLRSDFIDSVPFENVVSRDYQLGKLQKVIATNQELLTAFMQIFAKSGYATRAIVPAVLLGEFTTLTPVLRNQITSKIAELTSLSLTSRDNLKSLPVSSGNVSPKSKSSLPLLLTVFLVLLLILAIVIYLNQYNIS